MMGCGLRARFSGSIPPCGAAAAVKDEQGADDEDEGDYKGDGDADFFA